MDQPPHQPMDPGAPMLTIQNDGQQRAADDTTNQEIDLADVRTGELVIRARDGSEPAWRELVDRFTPVLWAIARRSRLRHADAADVVQATWLKLVENLNRIRDPDSIPGWLVTTCHREALRTVRVNARSSPHEPTDPFLQLCQPPHQNGTIDPVEALVRHDAEETLRAAVDELPLRQRQVLAVLSGSKDRPRYAHVATTLGVPIGSIGPTRQRALARLRRDAQLRASLSE